MRRYVLAACLLLVALSAGPASAQERLRLTTTTHTENSGLLKRLSLPFERESGLKVDVTTVGRRIASSGLTFVSRADESGTHQPV